MRLSKYSAIKPHLHYAIFLRLRLQFQIAIAIKSQVSFTLLRLHFASKCDFFQFKSQKSHNRSISPIYTMRFSCDCECKSLRLIRTSSNFSPRFRNRKYMRFPHLHYAIFVRLRLRFQIAIVRKSHSVNGALIYTPKNIELEKKFGGKHIC